MSNANIKTKNLEFNGTTLRIFEKIGFNSGKNWVINAFEGSFVEVDPNPISQQITGLINTDIDDGNLDKIDHISLKPSHLLCLYLEGSLPVGCILNAVDNETYVKLNEVPLNTSSGVMNFSIWVSNECEMATIDVNGDIV